MKWPSFTRVGLYLAFSIVKNVEHSWLLWLSKTMVSVPEGSGFVKNWIEEGKICVLVFVPYKSVQI